MKKIGKAVYDVMKIEAKNRGMKLSAEQYLYKKSSPYFYSAFYYCNGIYKEGTISFIVDIGVKYMRYDELRYSIISPDESIKFTDKLRANSMAMCPCHFIRENVAFDWDESEEQLSRVCNELLDYIERVQKEFLHKAEMQYGGLDNFYVANENEYPLMAGLTYVERCLFKDAERCFRNSKDGDNILMSFSAFTEDQVKRLIRDGIKPYKRQNDYGFSKSEKRILVDYALAMQVGGIWNSDRLKFGEPL